MGFFVYFFWFLGCWIFLKSVSSRSGKKSSKHLGELISSPEMFALFVVVQWAFPLARGGTLGSSPHTIYLQAATAATPFFFLKDRGNTAKCSINMRVWCICVRYHPQKTFRLERVNWNLQILLHTEKNIKMKTMHLKNIGSDFLFIYLFIPFFIVECSNAMW